MFDNIVHFEGASAAPREPNHLQGLATPVRPKAESQSVRPLAVPSPFPQPAQDLQWMQQLIEQQARLYQAAQKEHALALSELKRIAQTVCQKDWDARMRAGDNPEGWPPTLIANLIIQSIQIEWRSVRLTQDPDLATKHQKLLEEISLVQTEIRGLQQRLQMTEQGLPRARSLAVKDELKRPAPMEKRRVVERVSPSPSGTVQPAPEGWVALPGNKEAPGRPAASLSPLPAAGSGLQRVDDVVSLIATQGLCR